jgi:hypothetical protein
MGLQKKHSFQVEKTTSPAAARKAAIEKLRLYFARVDAQRQPVSEEEEEAIIDEAIRSTRPNYRSVD